MKNYKLKKEAVQFFQEKYAEDILPFETWRDLQVNMNALEEVKVVEVLVGMKDDSGRSSSISSWSSNGENKGATFWFTAHLHGMSNHSYHLFTEGNWRQEIAMVLEEAIIKHIEQSLP